MREEEIIKLWKSGLDKNKLAEIYKRNYNSYIKLIRTSVRHRHDGRFISNTDALYIIERIIYKHIMKLKEMEEKDK